MSEQPSVTTQDIWWAGFLAARCLFTGRYQQFDELVAEYRRDYRSADQGAREVPHHE